MNKIIVILGVLILVVIGAVLLLGGPQTSNQPTPQQTTENSETPTEAVSQDTESTESEQQANVKEFTVESKGLNFTPNEIRVNVGDTVRITYRNTLGTHDWTIDEFNAQAPLIDAGEKATVEFVADKKGTFEFYCSVPGHREAGMKGTLIVE